MFFNSCFLEIKFEENFVRCSVAEELSKFTLQVTVGGITGEYIPFVSGMKVDPRLHIIQGVLGMGYQPIAAQYNWFTLMFEQGMIRRKIFGIWLNRSLNNKQPDGEICVGCIDRRKMAGQ